MLTEYRGLTVAQLSALRTSLKGNATFSVTKNTLTKIAAREAGLGNQIESLLAGPSAIAFVDGDVVQAAKGLLRLRQGEPAAGDQGRRARRQGAHRGRGQQAG